MSEGNKTNIYTLGGTVQAGDGIYIPRKADQELLALCQQSIFAYVLTSRQMGKSSLMVQTAEQLAVEKIESVVIDLTQLGVGLTAEQWYLGLLSTIEDTLMLDTDVVEWWQQYSHLGLTQRLTRFFGKVLLVEVRSPIVIFVDEIDTTLSLNFTDDFFAAIRYLYLARAQNPEFKRLSFVLIGVATPGDLIRDPKRTPFNIGQRVDLTDFTFEEALPLAKGLGEKTESAQHLLRFVLEWTRGHPYLTQRLCSIIGKQHKDDWSRKEVKQAVSSTFFGIMSEQDNNLQFVRDMLTKRAPNQDEVLTFYRQIRLGKETILDEEQSIIKSHLKLSGVVRRENNVLRLRNRIYGQVFDRRWINEHLSFSLRDRWNKLKPALPSFIALSTIAASIGLVALYSTIAWRNAEISEIKTLVVSSYGFLPSDGRKALESSLKAATKMQDKPWIDGNTRTQVEIALLNTVHNVAVPNNLGGHAKSVWGITFSPDRKLLASASADNTVKLWNITTGKVIKTLKGHTNEVYSVIFSPDGKLLASASGDKTVRLWDTTTHKEIKTLKGHTNEVYGVSFSFDGRLLASTSRDHTVKLWDTITHKEITYLKGHKGSVIAVSFSPDGKFLASASGDKTVKLWDTTTHKEIKTLKGHKNAVYSVSFSADGKLLASASADKTVKLWDTTTHKEIKTLKGHTNWVYNISFSPNEKLLASASTDKTVKLWDTTTYKEIKTLKGHKNEVYRVSFSPDSKLLASASFDKTVKLWDTTTHKNIKTLIGYTNHVHSVSFSPDSKLLATGDANKMVKLWDTATRQEIKTFKGHTNQIWGVSFSPNSRLLASASSDNTVKLWDTTTHKRIKTLKGHTNQVWGVSFSPDSKLLASASSDNTVKLWDTTTYKEIATLKGHTNQVWGVSFSPDGKLLASGSRDNIVKFWDTTTQKEIATLKGHTKSVVGVSFSPDGKFLASVGSDNTVRLWDTTTHKEINSLTGHTYWVYGVSFSPDGKLLASASLDNTVRLWKLDFDYLLEEACDFMREYYKINPIDDQQENKYMCDAFNK